ncbi:hypothetical protein [Nocardia sp. X0981]
MDSDALRTIADPPPGPAFDQPRTRAAVRRIALTWWPILIVSAACGPLAIWLSLLPETTPGPFLHWLIDRGWVFLLVVCFVGVPTAAGWVRVNGRRRRALRRPWEVWRIRYIRSGRYEWVDLLDPAQRVAGSLLLSTRPNQLGKLVDPSTAHIWFAGDPSRYGVVTLPGTGELRYAYRSRLYRAPRPALRKEPGR